MSNKNSNTTVHTGIGFTGVLTIVFIILKLTNLISWSWWWVLSPIWIELGIVMFIIAIIAIVYGVRFIRLKIESKKYKRSK
jgi:hypothetical protein